MAQAYAASNDHKNAIDSLEFIVNDEPRVAGVLAQYQEQAGMLKLLGCHFSIRDGELWLLDEADDRFRPV